jgi:CHAD domain-containing protein
VSTRDAHHRLGYGGAVLLALAALDRTPYALVEAIARAARRAGAREVTWLRRDGAQPSALDVAEPEGAIVSVGPQVMRLGASDRQPLYVVAADAPPPSLAEVTAPGAVVVLLDAPPERRVVDGRTCLGLGPSGGGPGDPHGRLWLLRLDEDEVPALQPLAVAWDLARLARRAREDDARSALRRYLEPAPQRPTPRDARDASLLVGVLAPSIAAVFHAASGPWPEGSPDDPHAPDVRHVHQLRVATRRLRAALAVAEPALSARRAKRARLELRALGRALGPRRAADVCLADVVALRAERAEEAALTPRDPAEDRVFARAIELLTRRRRRTTRLLRAAHPEERGLEEGLALLGAVMEPRPGAPTLEVAARAALHARWAALFAALPALDPPIHDEALHALRIRAKQLRYTLELLEPFVPDLAPAETAKAIKHLQDALGKLHDHGELVAHLLGPRATRGEDSAALDALRARLLEREHTLRERALVVGRDLARRLAASPPEV